MLSHNSVYGFNCITLSICQKLPSPVITHCNLLPSPGSIKSCTSRGPKGIETSYGVLDPMTADGIYPKRCPRPDQHQNANQTVTVRIPNPGTIGSGISSCYNTSKPPYRKRTQFGVYVGNHPSPQVKSVTHQMSWNPDTTIPRECPFVHCRLLRLRKLNAEA